MVWLYSTVYSYIAHQRNSNDAPKPRFYIHSPWSLRFSSWQKPELKQVGLELIIAPIVLFNNCLRFKCTLAKDGWPNGYWL
jgi:hypothetical protein